MSIFPGVFEYEVVSAFGAWLGDWLLEHDGRLPSPDQAAEAITRLITRFLHQELREFWRGPLCLEAEVGVGALTLEDGHRHCPAP